jgi:putative membrane protein
MKLNFKKLALGAIVLSATAFLMPSCMNGNKTSEDSKDAAEKRNDTLLNDRKEKKDAQFLVDAAEISIEEIQLGQLAQTKSTDPEVKKVGQMMIADHTKSLNELKELASKKGITIPTTLTEDGQDEYNKLSDKKESDFNEDYCDKMVKGHKRAIDKFENASKNAEDTEIKSWATATLPTLRIHLDHADVCQSKEKNKDKKSSAGVE